VGDFYLKIVVKKLKADKEVVLAAALQ